MKKTIIVIPPDENIIQKKMNKGRNNSISHVLEMFFPYETSSPIEEMEI